MPRLHYSVIAKTDGLMLINGEPVNNRLHRIKSRKGGDDQKTFYKKLLEIMDALDVLTLPIGSAELFCEVMLRNYYASNGKNGWSEQEVFSSLTKLGRKPKFVGEFIEKIRLRHGGKNDEVLQAKEKEIEEVIGKN